MIISYLKFLFLGNILLHLQSIHKERFLPSLNRSHDTDRSCFSSFPVYRSRFLMILRMMTRLIVKNNPVLQVLRSISHEPGKEWQAAE